MTLRPTPVVFGCRGCERDGTAQQAAAALDVIEGCGKRRAAQWLAGHGVVPQRSFVLDPARSSPP